MEIEETSSTGSEDKAIEALETLRTSTLNIPQSTSPTSDQATEKGEEEVHGEEGNQLRS